MVEQVCPVCGCIITGGGYEKEGTVYCCEPCATGGECACGCGTVVGKKTETKGGGCRRK